MPPTLPQWPVEKDEHTGAVIPDPADFPTLESIVLQSSRIDYMAEFYEQAVGLIKLELGPSGK